MALAWLMLAVACLPPPPPAGWEQPYLTRSSDDVVVTDVTGVDSVRFIAPWQNSDANNTRVLLDRVDTPLSNDQTSCATAWSSGGWPSQEGVAVRILIQGDRTRALTVIKNVWAAATSVYVVHHWDTSHPEAFGQLATFDMSAAVGPSDSTSPELGRRLCTRVRGSTLTFKVWPAREPEPSWGDPVHVRSVSLPDSARHSGRPGWYAGHLPPSSAQTVTGMRTSNEDAPGTPLVK